MNIIFKSPYKNIFILSLLVYLITAFCSAGYLHPDEHFQILEFCNYKLGKSPISDLPWEFYEKIRPALQPALACFIIKILNFVSISNPFTYTIIFRILTALLSWFIVSKTSLLLINDFSSENGKKIFLFLNFFLWFIPFISVRFSSENYAAITFLSSVYLVVRYNDKASNKNLFQLIIAGLLLGFSIFFRFQVCFAIIGLGFWLILVNKMRWENLLILIMSGTCAIAFCIYLDFWFYGKFVFTPANYFFANIIENKAANWGTLPWWYYFVFFILNAIPPISILLLIFFLIGLFRKKTNIFTWCIIPFLIGHFVVGHKEMRFMFPMLFGFIYLAAIGIDYFLVNRKFEKTLRFLFIFSVVINTPLLIVKMLTPAQEAICYYKYLYNYSSKKEIVLLCNEKNIYDLVGLQANFYKSSNIKCIVLNDDMKISDYLNKYKPDSILQLERNITAGNKFAGYKNETIYCLFPRWVVHFNFNNWESRARIWKIQKLKKIKM